MAPGAVHVKVTLSLLAAGLAVPAFVACSGGSSFPSPAECAQAAPLPTATPGAPERGAYFSALRTGVDDLESELSEFRSNWPSGSFSRDGDFRRDFAKYADETRCKATYLRDMQPPGPELSDYDQSLDAALDDLLSHTAFGREAVRTRNVSEWRQWRDGVDAKIEAVRTARSRRGGDR
ncbi:MAG TPA: hypothetical protein VFS26_01175 [Solirubrobacterales bacterium]|nr:hypothetical protein [Solirubrobacterales bacterium]